MLNNFYSQLQQICKSFFKTSPIPVFESYESLLYLHQTMKRKQETRGWHRSSEKQYQPRKLKQRYSIQSHQHLQVLICAKFNLLHQRIISPLKRVWPFICPSPKNVLCQDLLKLAQWFWRRFLKVINVFLLLSTRPLKMFFNWTNLNFLHLKMYCAKFGCNGLSGSEEEDFEKLLLSYYFPLEKVVALFWKKKPSNHLLARMLVEIGPVVLEKSWSWLWKVFDQLADKRLSEKFTWVLSPEELKI